jgi:hypothetical protein
MVAVLFQDAKVEHVRALVRRSAFAQEIFISGAAGDAVNRAVERIGAAAAVLPELGQPLAVALAYNYIVESESALDSGGTDGRIARTIELLIEPFLSSRSSSESKRLRRAKKTTLSLSHDLHIYKAKFFPRMVRALMNIFGTSASAVVDPYCGSGTALLEASLLELPSFGCDIDPISRLIAATKVEPFLDRKGLERAVSGFEKALRSAVPAKGFVFPPKLEAKLRRRDRIDGTEYADEVIREAAVLAAALGAVKGTGIHAQLMAVLASDALTKKIRYRFVGVGNGAYTIEIVKQPLLERLSEKLQRCRELGGVFSELSTVLKIDLGSTLAVEGDARARSSWPDAGRAAMVLTSPPYLPASSGREHYAASRALAFAVLGFGEERLGYHDVPTADATVDFDLSPFREATSLMEYLESDANDDADPQRDAMRFERKAVPTKHYLADIAKFFASVRSELPNDGVLLLVVAHHHVFYSHRRQELEHVVSGRKLYGELAEGAGLKFGEEIEMQLMKSAASRAKPRAKDDYAESILVLRQAGAAKSIARRQRSGVSAKARSA